MSHTPVDYLLIGHITADLLPEGTRCPGGTVAYAARAAHAFGLRVGVVTSAVPGDSVLDALTPYAQVALVPAEATTTFENRYQNRQRSQYLHGLAAPLQAKHIPTVWQSAPLLHIAPIAGEASDPAILARFDAEITTRMLTLQGWLRRWDADHQVRFRRWFDRTILKDIDILIFSEEDIREAPDMEAELVGCGIRDLFVTQSARGGKHYHAGRVQHYTTPQKIEQHPTGAGDIFAACLLSGLHKSGDMQTAIALAATLAADSVTWPGLSGTPTHEQIEAKLYSHAIGQGGNR